MKIDTVEVAKAVVEIKLVAVGPDDVIFLTRLYRAMLFRDEIRLPGPADTNYSYVAGPPLDC